jgi:formate dehydrogenase alpha subunit
MSDVELTIDGRRVSGRSGQTILEAAKENGIQIPTLCYHPRLPISGACRVCVVEIEGASRLEASCSTPIRQGMIVHTNSERVRRARRMVVELLLTRHKVHCLTCESNGNCDLQDLAYDMEIDLDSLSFEIEEPDEPIDSSSPAIIRDPSKCILCGRCVAACQDERVEHILGFVERGSDVRVASGMSQPLVETDCTYCGECLQVCPTGALIEKHSRFMGRWWELKRVETTCPYCGVGCKVELYVKDGRIVKVRGAEGGVENMGSLCVKGRFGYDWVNSPERLTTPLIKQEGKFEPATWEEALNLVASRFQELKKEYGSNALAGLSSAKCTNEDNYIFQKFVRVCFGNNNVDHCARLCHAPTVVGLSKAFGSGAMTNSIRELLGADVIFVTGSNTTENHPVIAMYIKQAIAERGTKLIVADPRKIDLVDHATVWMRQRGGTDVALLNCLMNVIIREGLHDEEFIRSRCENFDEFRSTVERYTPDTVEEITGVPAEKIREAALILGGAKKASIVFSMGITQHVTGTDNVLSTANLAMLTGNVGRESTGVNPLRGQNNVQGACDLGALPNVFSGYQPVDNEATRIKFEEAWGAPLSDKPGLTVVETVKAAYDGDLKGLYVMGENPLMSDPDLNHVREALGKLDFLVVQDIFLSETAQMADVVLPVASFAEKDGTFTNTARRIQMVRKAIEPVGRSLSDWKIVCELACRMGYKMSYGSASDIMNEIAALTPIYGGVHHDRLEGAGLQWPCPSSDHPGTAFLHKDRFARGRGRFHAVEYVPPAEYPDADYPFLLTTGRLLQHFHTGTMTRRSDVLNSLIPECPVEINPEDAMRLGVGDGDEVRVESRRGKIAARAKVTERSPMASVFIPFHFSEAAANLLTNAALDPSSKIPELKVCAVRLEKIE